MNVVLVNPPTSNQDYLEPGEEKGFYKYVPLGLLYIAAVLEQEGHTVTCVDVAADLKREDTIVNAHADVVGFSATTLSYPATVRLAEKVKASSPETVVIFGGPHPSVMAEEALSTDAVDIVVRKEGENTIVEVLRCLADGRDLKSVKGISYRENGTCVSTPDRPFIQDLDALPLPARHLLNSNDYANFGSIITGRGCPYQCLFCAAGPLSGHKYRVHSIERVLEEIYVCHEQFGISDFTFLDDTFTALEPRVKALCTRFTQLDFPITWKCEARVNTVNKEILELMASSGCNYMQFGVESGSDYILRSIRKGITTAMVKKAVEWAVDAGIQVLCSFVIGHPDDTEETVEQTIEFSEELLDLGNRELVTVGFAVATPFPGTELYERAEELGITIHERDWSAHNFLEPIIDTKHLRYQQLRNFLFRAMLEESKGVLQLEEEPV